MKQKVLETLNDTIEEMKEIARERGIRYKIETGAL